MSNAQSSAALDTMQHNRLSAQIQVSCFHTHHRIIVRYPDFSVVDADQEDETDQTDFTMVDMSNFQDTPERYDPTVPLIQHPAVEAHAGRDNSHETSTFVLIPTTKLLHGPENFNNLAQVGLDALLLDMYCAQSYIGETYLSMITSNMVIDRNGTVEEWARVIRSTRYRRDNHQKPRVSKQEYNFPLVDLLDSDTRTITKDVAVDQLVRLYVRSDARAYRHANFMASIAEFEIETPSPKFKAPRHEDDLAHALRGTLTLADPTTLAHPDNKNCYVCTDAYNSTTTIAVNVPCTGNHIACADCIVKWATDRGLTAASCPLCRQKLFRDPLENQNIAFGLTNGLYHHDNRYTAWENFERSCADLDLSAADNSNTWIVVNTALLTGSWEHITQGAFLELTDADSVEATWHNPLASPEWRLVEQAIRHYLVQCSGIEFQVKALHTDLMHYVFGVFNIQFREVGLDRFLTEDEVNDLASDPMFLATYPLGVRPGLRELLHRCLHRMLRLIEVRKCDCHPDFHGHGLRIYYSPVSFTAPVIDRDGDVMME
ncbi:hypothetical protein LTR78_003367 [Recurvomyces mirabilis]|uniref:RING-type domain-containing protein n=1 Tax=Recurvomyces mirabilis TaxID=574656 RepID=A0AAE1C3N1_9PEZI|nr:hypothetical protein LTR78_003367 [Recurvomyces mirabilis]KAK5154597.1 hypothetical protein LTS14_006735 [Recurvomyces mirabilis]